MRVRKWRRGESGDAALGKANRTSVLPARTESRSPTNLKWKFKFNDPELRDSPGLKAPSGLDSEPGAGPGRRY